MAYRETKFRALMVLDRDAAAAQVRALLIDAGFTYDFAAERLDVARRTLYRVVAELGMSEEVRAAREARSCSV